LTIKIAYITKDMPINGISNVIMNYISFIDRDKYDITLICGNPINKKYESDLKKMGVEVFKVENKKKNPLKYFASLYKFLNENRFDIVHVHGNSSTITIELFLSKIAKIPVRIAHCHSNQSEYIPIHRMLHPFFLRLYTHGLACSELAGEWLFKNQEFKIIPNSFSVKKFIFDQNKRDEIRGKLEIDDFFVIGHIGRFNDSKNHEYLIQVFDEVSKIRPDTKLLIVGDGPLREKISFLISKSRFKENIILYNESVSPETLYSAMDLFVFPSKYEGLGIVLLEAQISGLRCVVSNAIPNEAIIGPNVTKLSLDDKLSVWVTEILKDTNVSRTNVISQNWDRIEQYDISTTIVELQQFYENTLYEKSI
jgi:glycosyltransferase involved in cell wall biosynthesis